MKKFILLLLSITLPAFAQFKNSDSLLIKKTFERDFSHEIFNEYLNSYDHEKTIAAIFALSHSEDTTIISNITGLDFQKYGKEIAFCLGQLGKSKESTDYLFDKIFFLENNPYEKECLIAIGKTGSKETLQKIINLYFDKRVANFDGISLCLSNFSSREIKSEKIYDILHDEIKNNRKSLQRKFEAIFALYRISPTKEFSDKLLESINPESFYNDPEIINYSLGCFTKLENFPVSTNLIEKLISHKDWTVRCQISKTLVYFDFQSQKEISLYFDLIKDQNPNVSIQAASNLSNIILNEDFKTQIKPWIEDLIKNGNLHQNAINELYLSFCNIYDLDVLMSNKKYSKFIDKQTKLKALGLNLNNSKEKYEYLLPNYANLSNKEKMIWVNTFLSLKDSLNFENYSQKLLELLSSDSPPIISIVSMSIDSLMISNKTSELEKTITARISESLNDPQHMESLMSLGELSKKIDKDFNETVLNQLFDSELYSIKKYAANELKLTGEIKKKEDKFNKIFQYIDKYDFAEIKTNKGSFTIQLSYDYTPISAANFCFLADKDFYDNVIFHRVVPNFVIQTGDPSGTGWGGPGYEIISEFSTRPYKDGYVGMASAGKDTEGSQWFVMHSEFPHLNRKYSNFGKILNGQHVVDIIEEGDFIIDISLR